MAPLYSSGDPVLRTSSPYPDPRVPGPASKILALNNNNYHSSSLSTLKLNMVTVNTVNKTALHPGGVLPVKEHTELEEELHEKAHIDYDRVAIVPNPSVAALYEDALVYETGSAITSTGALTAYSGAKTGRSPLDKRIVKEPSSENDIWWGPVNKPMTPDVSFHFALNSFVLSVEQHKTKLHCYFFGITFLGQSVVFIAKSPIHFLHVTCHYCPTQTCSIARLISFQIMGCHCLG
jgi:hypothetical protein